MLEAKGIKTFIKNEYAGGAMGEIAFSDAWAELYLEYEKDRDIALKFIDQALSGSNKQWCCRDCGEMNEASFEFCWKCQCSVDET